MPTRPNTVSGHRGPASSVLPDGAFGTCAIFMDHPAGSSCCTAASSSAVVKGLWTKVSNRALGSRFNFAASPSSSRSEVTTTGNAMTDREAFLAAVVEKLKTAQQETAVYWETLVRIAVKHATEAAAKEDRGGYLEGAGTPTMELRIKG